MKKNIIIGVLTVLTVLSWAYAFYWKINAEEQKAFANEQAKIADQAREAAVVHVKMAEEAKMEALMQMDMAEDALRKALAAEEARLKYQQKKVSE